MSGGDAKISTGTPSGCRTHAEQDRSRARAMDTQNGRLRLQRSAAAWDSMADDLDALAETHEARQAVARAEWNAAERRGEDEDRREERSASLR